METKFQTSFIPKREGSGNEAYSYKAPFGIFLIISIGIALISVLFAAGTFVYMHILNREVSANEQELEKANNDLQSADIDKLVRFADKIDTANKLLDSHIAVTPIFSLLEKTTLKRLQFTSLDYTYLASNKIAISMKGVAKDFGVVARQSDAFSEVAGSKFISPLFSDLNIDDKKNIIFSFITVVDPNLVLYKNYVIPNTVSAGQNNGSTSTSSNNH